MLSHISVQCMLYSAALFDLLNGCKIGNAGTQDILGEMTSQHHLFSHILLCMHDFCVKFYLMKTTIISFISVGEALTSVT